MGFRFLFVKGSITNISWADRDLIRKYGGTFNNITLDELIAMHGNSPYSQEKCYRELSDKGVALVRGDMYNNNTFI